MKRLGLLLVCCVVTLTVALPPAPATAAGVRIKIATKAPENFKSAQIVKRMSDEISEKTNKAVRLKIYFGGVKGSGRDLLLKIKSGEIQGGEFTAGEAASIAKDLRIMSFPMMFNSYGEVDYVLEKLTPHFQKELEKQGFVVLSWLETGFGHIMSSDKIEKMSDLNGKKVWIPQGDPVGQTAFEAMGVSPIPMNIGDVVVALQTGQINTFVNTFYGAIALQWYTRISYIMDTPLNYVYGLLMITKDSYDKIPAEYKEVVHEIIDRHAAELKADIRKSDRESRATLINQKIQFVPIIPDRYRELAGAMVGVKQELADKEFPGESLKLMQQYLKEYRDSQAK